MFVENHPTMKSFSLESLFTISLILLLSLPLAGQWSDPDQWHYYISPGQVNDALEQQDALWLATDYGLVVWDKVQNTGTYYYPHNSNLPGTHVSTISRATDGTVWIGTYDNMLAFFQDEDWVPADVPVPADFTGDPLLHDLEFGADGTKYIGTNYGLVTEKDGNWTIYDSEDITVGFLGEVWDIELDPVTGDVFLNGFEWHRFDGTDWFNLSDGNNLFFYGGGDICTDPTGTVWATNLFSGVARYQDGAVTMYDSFNEDHWIPSPPNSTLLQLEYFDGAAHLITQHGQLYRFDNEQWVLQGDPLFYGYTTFIDFLLLDEAGDFWASEDTDLFYLSDGAIETNDLAEFGFSSSYARHFLQNPEPNSPLMIIDGKGSTFTYQEDGSLAPYLTPLDSFAYPPFVWDAKWNANNELWIASNVGVFRLKEGIWTRFHADLGNFPSQTAISMAFDNNQRPYLATNEGVYYYHNEDWISLNQEISLPIYDFNRIEIDHSGTIWLLRNYENILIRVEGNAWSGFDHTNAPWEENGYIHSLFDTENNGLMVIGNYQNIFSFKDGVWSTLDLNTNDPFGTYLYAGFEGPDDQLILSSSTGIFIYEDGASTQYNSDNSLMLSSQIYHSALAADGALWMCTNTDGIHRMANFTEPMTTAVEDAAEQVRPFSVFPNPVTSEVLTIQVPSQMKVGAINWSVVNPLGQNILTGHWEHFPGVENQEILLGDLPQGWYMLQIRQGDQVWISKVIVQ
jgi:hypothetical protein